ncbi:hypothetical protein SAMN05421813_10684 [Daejeonella rubra]|uniref:Uncharacterized protein n=1 Tax=Daejeonella rubra TaxID=990371 RepID=A0A1G9QKH2_9SPHI|nr:hypothetical protein SAMN05421813_10684 [Daejeonella rubra]
MNSLFKRMNNLFRGRTSTYRIPIGPNQINTDLTTAIFISLNNRI